MLEHLHLMGAPTQTGAEIPRLVHGLGELPLGLHQLRQQLGALGAGRGLPLRQLLGAGTGLAWRGLGAGWRVGRSHGSQDGFTGERCQG